MQMLDQALLDSLCSARRSIRTTRCTYASDKRRSSATSPTPALMPKLDVTGPTTAGRRRRLSSSACRVIDEYLKEVLSKQRLGPAFPRRRSAAHPPVRRPAAAAPGAARDGVRAADAVRNHAARPRSSASRRTTAPTSPTTWASRPLPRQRHAPAQRHGRGDARHSVEGADARPAQPAARPCAHLCRANNGLILVTGKTGSGKSTTLAAMIDDINSRMKGHILTIEDPIEFVHPRKQLPDQPARSRRAHQGLRDGAAIRPARRSRRGAGRRVARLRDHEHRGDRRGDGHPGHGHAAHQRRRADRRSHGQRVPRRQADRTCAPCCRRRCAAWSRSSCCRRADKSGRVAALEILVNTPAVVQPDPPGQARPAREHHAVGQRSRHAHHGHRHPGSCSTSA